MHTLIALELTGAQHGFVLSPAADGGVAGLAEQPPSPELVAWAEKQLDFGSEEETAVLRPNQTLGDTSLLTLEDMRYCVILLGAGQARLALALGFRGLTPRAPSAEVLATLASHLAVPANDAQA